MNPPTPPQGSLSAQSKFKKSNISNYFRVLSIAVGVDINKMITIVSECRMSLLKMNIPRLLPPRFFHNMSIGSLAMLTRST